MLERLNFERDWGVAVAPAPTGIENDPQAHGIAVEEVLESGAVIPVKPEVIAENVRELGEKHMGRIAASLAFSGGYVPGNSYSSLSDEEIIAEEARLQEVDQLAKETEHLESRRGAIDPRNSEPAQRVLDDGINPRSVAYATKILNEAAWLKQKRDTGGGLSVREKRRLTEREKEYGRVVKKDSSKSRAKGLREFGHQRRDVSARKGYGRRLGKDEVGIEAVMSGRGLESPFLGMTAKEVRIRQKEEDEMLINKVSKIGTVLEIGGRRFWVEDVVSQPAQAFVVVGRDKMGNPEFAKDPTTGQYILENIYHSLADEKGKPVTDPLSGKPVVDPSKPIPRHSNLRSGKHIQNGPSAGFIRSTLAGDFFYADGSPVLEGAIDHTSFSVGEDIVHLKPLFTGGEAFRYLVSGAPLTEELEDLMVRLSKLAGELRDENIKVLSAVEDDHIFRETTSTTDPALLPNVDRVAGAGHFEKPRIVDPVASGKKTRDEFLRAEAGRRIAGGRKYKYMLRTRNVRGGKLG